MSSVTGPEEDDAPPCESCGGMGVYDIGDVEDGVQENCKGCDGTGRESE